MLTLLIIADDFTGALDAGVQFASLGAKALVVTDKNFNFEAAKNLDVLIFDAETRHIEKNSAYKIVYDFVKRARDFKIPYIYKKTDSGLRGNIGAELSAAMDALEVNSLAFVPAFPAMKRVTRGGVHYVDGVPVNKSMFGSDPFEPVKFSRVDEIIASQTDRHGIKIFDAETDGDMIAIAGALGHDGLKLTAGCAGFAGVLAHVLGFHGRSAEVPKLPAKFFMVCGSVNPVTRRQMEYAEHHGFKRIYLSVEQKFNPENVFTGWAADRLKEIEHSHAILDANNPNDINQTKEYEKSHGLTIEDVRVRISRAVTGAAKSFLDLGLDARLMCVGGDTLLALMQTVGVHELVPLCEIETGVVLTTFAYNGKNYYIMTKSGAFGEDDLLVKLAEKI